ncbi:MAG: FtsW/RodA/SpoVE family cell cycle protein [Bacilli bacterium]|nr:FtsW/RodA/SpoVE family cell cycle protein [Bacilli bacterium]
MKKEKMTSLFFYIPLLMIMTISLLVMLHAKNISPLYQNNALKQSIFFAIGLFLLLLKDKLPLKKIFAWSFLAYLFNCFLLILVLLIGSSTKGAKAWFHLGFFSFQPSELMKLTLCLYLSYLTEKQSFTKKKDEIKYLFKVFIIVLIPSILVFLEPDTGAILFYLLIALAIILSSKCSKKWIIFIFTMISILTALFFYAYFYHQDILIKIIGTSFFYRVDRLLNFQKGLQIENALIALGSAPFFDLKLYQTGIYIPEAPTDFAFALTANVFGLIGNIILLICYFLIDCYLIKIWKNTKKEQMKYFCSSFLLMFISNQIYNIAMNIGIVPIMGIPLPLLSYGGSTTMVYFLFLMIILKKN